ncbi:MAG: class I SAM-dependent methyltransferase [bacterium]|nr:class I SAM-dependent methyltransferase [bacterium]
MNATADNRTENCPLCGSASHQVHGERDDIALLRCADCNLVFKTPRPDVFSLKAELEGGYFTDRDQSEYIAARRPVFRGLLDRVARHRAPPGRLLDVGCARGVLLLEAAETGYDAFGLDLSVGELAAGRKLGVRSITLGLLEDAPFPDDSFDVITLFDFVEHALLPGGAMQAVSRLLGPGGVVALYTGNVASKRARGMGMDWDYIYKDGHVNFFDERSLRYMIDDAGLDIIELQYSTVDAAADEALKRAGLPTERLRELFNKRLLPLKKAAKAVLCKAMGGEGIFLLAGK